MAEIASSVFRKFVIPAGKGTAFNVRRGQVLKIIALEGDQCLDAVFFNAQDLRETFHAFYSYSLNVKEGIGDAFHVKKLYSKPPWERVMMTVVEDTVKNHFVVSGGRCSPGVFRMRDGLTGHPNCQENLAAAIEPYGLGPHDVPDVFNIFMNAGIDDKGLIYVKPSLSKQGDHIDLRAEMDILCAISACPSTGVCNNGIPKPVGIEILEP
jgi:uncharacterized protein YcgI (DUF1989 family)